MTDVAWKLMGTTYNAPIVFSQMYTRMHSHLDLLAYTACQGSMAQRIEWATYHAGWQI